MHGWGYQPIYEVGADRLWRAAQARNDAGYRGVAVRDHACLHRRLVGFAVHELIHALVGDPTQANFGVPFGLPYGVPVEIAPADEKAYLAEFNAQEARAFVGVGAMARALYDIDWAVYTARDVGTYGFAGGWATVEVPPGFRPVPHVDRQHQPDRYYALARRLEADAAAWFTEARIAELVARVEAAEAAGRAARPTRRPPPEQLAALRPRAPSRNDPCPCGSRLKYKRCCGASA
ncbi:MAG: SEC-C domain-containing protein [Kofleriaceae bacterium]|nr:SEC-C domain-containing protein [Kofleriaceae bacterium]